MALSDNLTAYWKLDEASGTRNDAHSTNHLTDNNTVGSATGKISNAADFEADNSEYLSVNSNAELTTGDIDFTITFWVKFETVASNRTIITKSDQVNANTEYLIRLTTDSQIRMRVLSGNTGTDVDATNFGALSTGTWYHVVAYQDSASDLIGVCVNAGTPNTTSISGLATNSSTSSVYIGTWVNLWYMDGLIDEVGFWKRVLTSQERTDLYNSGNGWAYPFNPQSALPLFVNHYQQQGIM